MSTAYIPEKKPVVSAQDTKFTIKMLNYAYTGMTGFVSNGYYDRAFYFSSEVQLIQITEALLESLSFPQRAMDYRSFLKRAKGIAEKMGGSVMSEIVESNKTKATFVVHVKFRQNATWQGTIDWVELKKTQQFRSTLELLMLIATALSDGKINEVNWVE